ncbi:T9SS type A sorting domain-containing protein [Limnovirga soli]|uniref:T9SS type A sorting domain-containing protein n=1 Tax=Limnovirga soli TaxID=2656915 RepID=A0A8J8FB55_9BACT|nr:T9SS type A sorting domain-containing protein [Limnovirga soli]NNV54327.1 T9SS type A sorting domain-containing protein [Limnovirga soli]
MKIIHFILALFTSTFFFGAVNAQVSITSQQTVGGNADDKLSCLLFTNDGGTLAAGFSSSGISGEKTENSRGSADYWVVKRSKTGLIQWDKTIGGSLSDQLITAIQTLDSGYLLAGVSQSGKTGDKTDTSRGGTDFWIIKLRKNGNIAWQKTFGGKEDDECRSVQQTADGGYILGGHSRSDISGDKSENSKGGSDFWLIKTDKNGNKIWDRTFGGNDYDGISSLQQTGDGGYILGGKSDSNISGEKSQNSKGGFDYWLVKVNNNGNIIWDKTIGGNAADNFKYLQITKDKGYILGGFSASNISGDKTENSRGANDYWVVKLDSLANIQWDKTIGGNADEQFYALQQTLDLGYILAGYSRSPISGEKSESGKGLDDYWLVKLDRNGNFNWDKTIGGSLNDDLTSVKEIKRNQFILGGFSGSGISFDKTESSRGLTDYWIVNILYTSPAASNTISQMPINIQVNNEMQIYPNPAKNQLFISSKTAAAFTLYSNMGKALQTNKSARQQVFNVNTYPNGIYYIKKNQTGATKTFIIQR